MFKAIGSLFRSANNLCVGLERVTEIAPIVGEGFRDEQLAINEINALERKERIEALKAKSKAKAIPKP